MLHKNTLISRAHASSSFSLVFVLLVMTNGTTNNTPNNWTNSWNYTRCCSSCCSSFGSVVVVSFEIVSNSTY
jgi:hypothetical protein